MRGVRIALFCVLCVGTARAEYEIPGEFAAAVQRANDLGDKIYLHDMAASRATDELAARKLLETDRRIRGWLTDEYEAGGEPGVIVTFIGDVLDKPAGLYRVRVPPGNRPMVYEALTPAAALDQGQLARWQARHAATEALQSRDDLCGDAYNTVVLPPDHAGGGIVVYALAATSRPDLMIAGGHFRFEYSADGLRQVSQRAFTRSCVDIPFGEEPGKGRPVGLTLTHLLDPAPTEVHAWLSHNYRQSIYLGTTQNSLMWVIIDGHIVAARSFADKTEKKKR